MEALIAEHSGFVVEARRVIRVTVQLLQDGSVVQHPGVQLQAGVDKEWYVYIDAAGAHLVVCCESGGVGGTRGGPSNLLA